MKKVLLTLTVAAFAASVFAQGTIFFGNVGPGFKAPIYGPEVGSPGTIKTGNTSAGTPAGTQVYTGPLLAGSGFFVQLFAASGTVGADVLTAGPTTTFRTGTAAGYTPTQLTVSIAGIPADAATITMQLRAWDNSSGLYPTWASCQNAWNAGLIAAGVSPLLTGGPAGGGVLSAFEPVGLQSFNIYMVPEPTTMALAGLSAAALLIFRRRK